MLADARSDLLALQHELTRRVLETGPDDPDAAVEAFLAEVDELRLDVDRLAARVARAEKMMKEKTKE